MRLITDSHALRSRRRTCAVTGRANDSEGFFDTHQILPGWDNEVCISVAAVREMARQLGMVPPEEVAEQIEELSDEVDERIAQVQEFVEAVNSMEEEISE